MEFAAITEKPLKPAEYAERQLLETILNSKYVAGQVLPAERELAKILGVTRPTLRETLQRLSREGWVTIRHGKPTLVNDYLKQGGLGTLNTLTKFGKGMSNEIISNLLQVRSALFPSIVLQAVQMDPESILEYLKLSNKLTEDPKEFSNFDWGLQMCIARATKNPVFVLMINDFTPLYESLGKVYFQDKGARDFSRSYYKGLIRTINSDENKITDFVRETLEQVEKIWQANNENN